MLRRRVMQYRIVLILTALLVYGGSLTGSYLFGRSDGKQICATKTLVVYKEVVKRNADIQKQVSRMAESDLDLGLSRWMR